MPKQPAIDLSQTPLHLNDAAQAVLIENFNFDGTSFEAYIEEHCTAGSPGRIVMIETTAADWSTWERHPLGDEVVIVLDGEGDFIQQYGDAEVRIPVQAGDTVVNPAGVWHSADVRKSIRAIYITPAPGTDHKPRA